MRFQSLSFRCFGGFDDRTLDFGDGTKNLHLVFGPNEAGKSTALAGLTYFLFGFPRNITYAFRHGGTEQRIAATLVSSDGQLIEAVRRRANKNPLRALDDRTNLPDDCIRRLLGGLDEQQFEMLFGLNHERLIDGGTEIAQGRGDLGQALFAAGAGLSGLRRIDERLRTRLEALFKKSGSRQVIAQSLAQLKSQRTSLRECTIAIDAWAQRKDELESSLAAIRQMEEERGSLRAEDVRLTAYRSALPTLDGIRGLEEQLRGFENAPLLPAKFGEDFRELIERRTTAEVSRDFHRADVESRQAALDGIVVETTLLAEADAILQIKQDLGAVLKAERDRENLVELQTSYRESALAALRSSFQKETEADAESLKLSPSARQQIRSLGQSRAALELAVDSRRERIAELDRLLADLDQPNVAAAGPSDDSAWEQLDREILQEGPIEKSFESELAKFRRDRDAAHVDIERLAPTWVGSLKLVPRLTTPSLERIVSYETEFARLDAEIREKAKQRDTAAKTLRDCARRLQSLDLAGHVPDESELHAARRERDRGIDLLAAPDADGEKEYLARHGLGGSLIEAVQGSVRHCDNVADQMRREASRVNDAARYRDESRAATDDRDAAQSALDELTATRTQLLAQWAGEWRAAEIQPDSPTEMRAWLQRFLEIRKRVDELRHAAKAIEQRQATIDEQKAKVAAVLGIEADKTAKLADLHEALKRAIDAREGAKTAEIQRATQRRDAKNERATLVEKLEAAERQLAEWRESWRLAIEPLGLSADADVTTATAAVETLDEIQRAFHEAHRLTTRLKSIDRDREQFVERLEAIRERLDGVEREPLNAKKLDVAVDDLVRRVNEAKLRSREREKIEIDLKKSRQQFVESEQTLARCQAGLQSLGDQAGFASVAELPALIGQSDRRRELESRLAEERARLRHHAGEQECDAFAAAALAARQTIEGRLVAIRAKLEELDREIPRQAIAANTAQEQIERWQKTSSEAAERQQAIESLLAQLREQMTEYAAVHLARQTLRLTIERFRERRHDSLLAAAERYFAKLTCGAFQGLDVDENERGESILRAVRKQPNERVEIENLSAGTRDQLFFALRLAGIEQHLRSHGPMPVIVDDVFVNFDESREAATLECLADLSKQTQVLVFTHHSHVVALAKRVAEDSVCCHDLSAGAAFSVDDV